MPDNFSKYGERIFGKLHQVVSTAMYEVVEEVGLSTGSGERIRAIQQKIFPNAPFRPIFRI